jgi:pyruvate carboxylase subunit B
MPGLVVRVQVEPGQAVAAGAGVVVLEAMKMENELRAAAAGTVRTVRVRPGEAVEKGQALVEFEPAS